MVYTRYSLIDNVVLKPTFFKVSVDRSITTASGNYVLFAIIIHLGTATRGHFISYVRRNTAWFEFDDAKVIPAEKDKK